MSPRKENIILKHKLICIFKIKQNLSKTFGNAINPVLKKLGIVCATKISSQELLVRIMSSVFFLTVDDF